MRPFWTFLNELVAGQLARAEQVNSNLAEVETAFEGVGTELDQTIRFTDGNPAEADYQIAANAAARANKVIGFDATGLVPGMVSKTLTPRGLWVTVTAYAIGDVSQAGTVGSLYYCVVAHTSGTFATDLAAVKWVLLLDATVAFKAARAFQIITNAESPYTAVAGDDLFVDVTAGAVTINLPASPAISDQSISIVHAKGDVTTNNITVGRNGKPLMALTEDMTINTTNAALELAYMDGTQGWRLVRGV